MLSIFEAHAINIMAQLQNLAKRMERYGAVSLSEYRKTQADVNDVEAWNNYVLQLVYADLPTQEDEDEHVVYARVMQDIEYEFRDMKVRYTKSSDGGENFLHVAIPVANGTYLSFVIGHDGLIEPMDVELIANHIEEDTSNDFK